MIPSTGNDDPALSRLAVTGNSNAAKTSVLA
jgi:hypothetical protein